MSHENSALDLASLAARLAQLETRQTEQTRIIAEQASIITAQARVITELHQMNQELQATNATLRDALDTAHEQIALLKKRLFSVKRERFVASPDQRLLFETTPLEPAAPQSEPEPVAPTTPRPTRRSRRQFVFPDFLPVVRHEHKLAEQECPCGQCGCERKIINTLVTRHIEIERAKAFIEEHVRYTYACSQCRDGKQMVTTEKPPQPLEKSPFGASLLAWIISAKFERHLPTYRQQEMLLEPLGMWLSRPLLARLLAGSAQVLRPLAMCLWQEILHSYVVQADETPIKYLGGEKGKSSTGYLFGYAGDAEHRFLFYDFRPSRARAGPAEILADYRGMLLSDGFSGYEALIAESQGRLRAAACWMHARREFDEARATTSDALVEETLARVRLLYDMEDRARTMTFEERHALRQQEARPLVEQYFARLEAARDRYRPTSQLAKAVHYSLNRRVELSRFLEDGRIELDTGLLERSLRGPALGRKNFLFFGSLHGGRTAATLYSIVQSARLYQLDVTAYLTDILRRLATLSPADTSALRELLPDRWANAHPQSVLQARQQETREALEQRRYRRAQKRLQRPE